MSRMDVMTARKGKDDKTYWTNVGSAWPLRDKPGYSIELSAYPLPDSEGKVRMVLMTPKTRDEAPARQAQRGAAPADLGDDIPFFMEWR